MKKNKKLKALILTCALACSTLMGCSSNAPEKTEAAKGNGETVAAAAGEKEVELTFPCIWVGSDSKAAVFGQMVEAFNTENAGKYKINIEEQTDYDSYEDKIRTLISTGTAPDLFTVKNYGDVQLFAQSGNLMDLSAIMSDTDMSGRFISGILEDTMMDGTLYAMPYENAVIPIMYNQKLLDAAGVTELPTSFEELFQISEKIKETGIAPLAQMTGNNAWTSMLWYSYAVAACGGADIYEKGLDDPAFVQAAELLQKMFGYTSSDAIGADATVVNGHFFNERAAIYLNGTWILGRIKTEGVEGLYDNLKLSTGLSQDGKNGNASVNAVQAYICAGRQDDPARQEAVMAFLNFITEQARVAELANSSGALFAVDVDSTLITDPLQAEIVKQSSEASFIIKNFSAAVPTAVGNAFPSALEELILGDCTAEEFVETLKNAQ